LVILNLPFVSLASRRGGLEKGPSTPVDGRGTTTPGFGSDKNCLLFDGCQAFLMQEAAAGSQAAPGLMSP
jgi:hypothetical protein